MVKDSFLNTISFQRGEVMYYFYEKADGFSIFKVRSFGRPDVEFQLVKDYKFCSMQEAA